MSSSKLVLLLHVAWVIIMLLALQCQAEMHGDFHARRGQSHNGGKPFHPSDCPSACSYRCSATSHRKPCMFYCNLCCSRCLCVPPGTYGNKQACPCYNSMKNARGGPKCP